ncbi:MAG: hypothetical protein G01um101425_524 [Candidatus Peregrinibacteria bacterium Gr01-1014_25]|nr:MAG: hypothetical protein G01um101425_524 [Candidatus Peregrinibacteria bacterium Gr01-1014_25]
MQTTVSIPGIHCASCAELIKDVSADFPQITGVAVDIDGKRVTLEHAPDLSMDEWRKAVEGLGDQYTVHSLP